MALENTDVFVVQKQTGGKENRKLSFQQLQEALGSGPAVVFKGVLNMTSSATQPSDPAAGDLYINDTAGTFAWTTGDGYTGQVQVDARAIWSGTGWSVSNPPSGDLGVEEVKNALPITVDNATPSTPIVGVNEATTTVAGDGTVTAQTSGVVTIATDANVAAGDDNLVVTSKQLHAVDLKVDSAAAGGVAAIVADAPITVTTDGTSVGGATTSITQPGLTISNALSSAVGVVKLIDTGVTVPDTTSTTLATVPKYIADFYLVKDFSSLTDIADA